MNVQAAPSPTVDSRTAWIVAGAALAILTIAYGAPLLSAVALKPIAAEFGTARATPAAAPAFLLIGAAFGGVAAGWLSGWLGMRRIVERRPLPQTRRLPLLLTPGAGDFHLPPLALRARRPIVPRGSMLSLGLLKHGECHPIPGFAKRRQRRFSGTCGARMDEPGA